MDELFTIGMTVCTCLSSPALDPISTDAQLLSLSSQHFSGSEVRFWAELGDRRAKFT